MNHYHAAFIGKVNNVIRYGKFYGIYFYSRILGELKRIIKITKLTIKLGKVPVIFNFK